MAALVLIVQKAYPSIRTLAPSPRIRKEILEEPRGIELPGGESGQHAKGDQGEEPETFASHPKSVPRPLAEKS